MTPNELLLSWNNAGVTAAIDNSLAKCVTIKGDTYSEEISFIQKTPDVDPEVKSTINLRGKTLYANFYKDGFKTSTKELIPDIKNVIVHNNSVVIVEFVDGTTEKAVLNPEDKFSLEQGISICLTKRLVGGSAIYNKLMERALKVHKNNEAAKIKKETEEKERKELNRKIAEKKAARKAKKREEYINTQKEAYLRAWAEINALNEDVEK